MTVTSPQFSFDDYLARYSHDSLSPDDVISIMVGDLQRIREYPARGFQIPQQIPGGRVAGLRGVGERGLRPSPAVES